nr:hypothetical protein [Tanacetum cinerariifolium]
MVAILEKNEHNVDFHPIVDFIEASPLSNKIMARLQFCDYHNMAAILEKSEHNIDFHPIMDFVEASPLRYALTVKPTVYISYIRHFWSTARMETTKEGTKILTTIDGILRTITESSLGRNLKLQDKEGISSLPDTELFENLTLIGYNISPNQKFTFQKGQFSHQWKYLIHTIMQCMSLKSTGFNEFSSNIATTLVCLVTNRTYNFSKMIFYGMVKNVNNKVSKFLIPSFSGRIVPLFDTMLVPPGEGSVTPSEPHHTPSTEAHPTSHPTPSSPTLPPVTTAPIPTRDVSQGEACPTDSDFKADQDRATIAKTSTLPHDSAPRVTSPTAAEGSMQQTLNELMDFCTILGVAVKRSGDDAPIKGRNLDEGEAAVERVSDDTKDMATVLTSMDAATILASGVAEVPTGSGSIPTTGWKVKDFRGMTFEEIEAKFTTVWKQLEDFIPMGSKEEVERLKRKGLNLEQESVKKLKTSKEVLEEVKSPDEVPKEKVKEMMQLVPIEEVYVEALQIKPPIIDWKNLMHASVEWKFYDTCRVHHVTAKDKEIFMLVEKDYPLRKGLAVGMISYKLQVENYSKMANDLILKIYKIASSPRQQGRIVRNKMHKAFPLPVIEFLLPVEVPTASEESCHCQKKREAT